MRDIGAVELFQGIVPEWLLPVVVAITHTASIVAFALICIAVYWFGDRDRGAYILGVVLGGLALTFGLKAVFGLPRPPTEVQLIATRTTAFPSGHALGSTVVFGILALTMDSIATRRIRLLAAAGGVVLVSASRLVLGVHYLGDVLAGILIGVAYLAVVSRRRDPGLILSGAVGLALLGLFAGGLVGRVDIACLGPVCVVPESLLVFGASLGAALGWLSADVPRSPWPITHRSGPLAVVSLVPVALLVALGLQWEGLLVASFVGSVVLGFAFVTLPAVLRA